MQERGAAARQAGNEDRLLDRLIQNCRVPPLRITELQQIGQEPQHVPARGHSPDQAERSLIVTAGQQPPQWLDE